VSRNKHAVAWEVAEVLPAVTAAEAQLLLAASLAAWALTAVLLPIQHVFYEPFSKRVVTSVLLFSVVQQ
jgi:hypothetical protein